MNGKARLFIASMAVLGSAALYFGAHGWQSNDPVKFIWYLLISLLASRLRVQLPGITGTMSVNFLFILLGIVELSLGETLVIGCTATLAQSFVSRKQWPKAEQLIFNFCSTAFAIAGANFVFHGPLMKVLNQSYPLLLMLAACTYFLLNTLPVATIISLTENKSLRNIWTECYFWSFPYYLVGAAIAGMVSWLNRQISWQTSLLAFPAVFVIYRSYRLYLGKLENEKKHVEDMAG